MLSAAAEVEPILWTGAPFASTDPENCTYTESLVQRLFWALPRIHRWYGTPACAWNVSSK